MNPRMAESEPKSRSGPISVAMVGPDISGLAPGGMATISTLLLREFASRDDISLVPIANFEEGRWIRRLSMGLRAIGQIVHLRNTVDIVHIQVAVGLSIERDVLLALMARALRLTVVTQFHGGQAEDYGRGSAFHRVLYRLLIRLSVKILVLGSKTAGWVHEVCPRADTAIIPNFVTPNGDGENGVESPPAILYVGWLKRRKGVLDLLSALGTLRGEGCVPRVWIAGDGELVSEQEFIDRIGELRDSVILLGWKEQPEIAQLMNGAIAVVLPSYSEGLPMVILEAMAAGRAVIATRVGEVGDAIVDGENGILISPGDVEGLANAIREVVTNPAHAREMGKAGLARVETVFSAKKVIKDLSDIYKSAAANRLPATRSAG